jgi:PAS domain S-box-containing protein
VWRAVIAPNPPPMRPSAAVDATRFDGQASAREFRDLVNSLDDVVFRFDEAGRWSYLSPAWERRLGWKIDDCLGRAAVKFVHREERGHVLHHWSSVLAGEFHDYRREVRFLEAGGGFRWMLVSARGLRDDDGALRGVTGTLTDVSAFKAVEAELIAARAAAEVANKAKSEFLSTMSHELRTPLNAVIGLSESLLEIGPPFDPDRTRRYLGLIQQSGRQLLAQINDILDLARIEAGRVQVHGTRFDVRSLCHAVLEAVQRDCAAKGLTVHVDAPGDPVAIWADERLLRQVMQNLVSNAVKFTGPRGRVTLSVERRASGGLGLSVSDTGIGIAPAKIGLLFKPFSQLDSSLSRQFGGTGLGLVLVERIVRLHGGTVTVQSEPGKGSTFTVELPAAVFAAPVHEA